MERRPDVAAAPAPAPAAPAAKPDNRRSLLEDSDEEEESEEEEVSNQIPDFLNSFPIRRTYFFVLPPHMIMLGFFHVTLFCLPHYKLTLSPVGMSH